MKYREPLFRPPGEAGSLIIQVAYGCPHNSCRFCGMYKGVPYEEREEGELFAEIREAGKRYPETTRIFLADGDCLYLPGEKLLRILAALQEAFPRLARVGSYSNGSSILKNRSFLPALKAAKLDTLYMGLESGSEEVLRLFGKGETPKEMVEGVQLAQEASLRCSVMILLGLGGKKHHKDHIEKTAEVLIQMQPRLLSALRFIPMPFLQLPQGFEEASEYEVVEELYEIFSLAGAKIRTVFRSDHVSVPVPLSGRLPQDRDYFLRVLGNLLASGRLDKVDPAPKPPFFQL